MPVNVRKINHERLGRWEKRLNENNSTPILLVGIGHQQVQGQVMILTTEDRTNTEIVIILKEALRQLEGN